MGRSSITDLEGCQAYRLSQNFQLSSFLNSKVVQKNGKTSISQIFMGKSVPSKFHCNRFFAYHIDLTEKKKEIKVVGSFCSSFLAVWLLILHWTDLCKNILFFLLPHLCNPNLQSEFLFYPLAISHLSDCKLLKQGCHLLQATSFKQSSGEFKTQLLLTFIGVKCLHKIPKSSCLPSSVLPPMAY